MDDGINVINNAIDMWQNIKTFNDVVKANNASLSDIEELRILQPSIMDTFDAISAWLSNQQPVSPISETDTTTQIPTVSEKDINNDDNVDEKHSRRQRRFNNNEVVMISEFIADKFDNKKLLSSVKPLLDKFGKRYSEQNLIRLLNKRTFASISDGYFIIENGIIKAVTEPVPKPTDTKVKEDKNETNDEDDAIAAIRYPSNLIDKISNSTSPAKLGAFINLLSKNHGDVYGLAKGLSPDECLQVAVAKIGMTMSGIYPGLDEATLVIIISDAIKCVGKRKISKIHNYINKTYGIEVDNQVLFDTINKNRCPELSDKFFK